MCVLDLWMLCLYVERCFESLTCWVDLFFSSLLVAFIFMYFSSLEKLFFFKLDSFSTNTSTHPLLSSFFALLSIDFQKQADPSSFSSDLFVSLTNPWYILDPSRFLSFFSILRDDFLELLSPRHLFDRCFDPSRSCFCRRKHFDSTSIDSLLLTFSAQ